MAPQGAHVRPKPTRVLVLIACAFAITTAAFLAASFVSLTINSEVDEATADLLKNALPSVRDLGRARAALRQLRTSARESAFAPPPRDEAELKAHFDEIEAALTAATTTRWYAGELAVYQDQVRPALENLDHAVEDFGRFANAPWGDRALSAATLRLGSAVDRADAGLDELSRLNHEQAFAAARRIGRTREDAARATLFLDVGSTVIGLIAAVLAVAFTRRFDRVLLRNVELETERAQQLDLVAQRVAHDLMSPLAAVSLSLSSVQRKHRDEDTARAVERAQRVLERSRRMVEGIYAFAQSGVEPTGRSAAPLRAAVLDAVSALRAVEGDRGPSVDVQGFDEVDVGMDRGMLDVVLSNLLSNASKFMADSPVRRITVRACAEAARVHVEIEDTGPGVPPALADAVFEPYKRTPGTTQPGLGLGLATVKRLIVGHGGAVGVRNAPTGGAVFWFELPRVRHPTPAAEAVEETRARAGDLHPRPSG